MHAISTHGLTKVFDDARAVDAVTMHIERGEIYGLIGKNGAGKSTLMKMIAGLTIPTSGGIEVLGRDILVGERSVSLDPSHIGMLIEDPGLLERFSAMENLMAKALALGVVDPHRHCQELLELVGLQNAEHKACKHFSLGMKQRLGIALALVGNPEVLLLDEPFNGLDPDATRQLRRALVTLSRERNITIMISSHVLDQLDRMATRFGILGSGQLIKELSAEQLHEACTSSIRVSCEDNARALAVLEQQLPWMRLRVEPDGSISIAAKSGDRDAGASFGGGAAAGPAGLPSTADVARILREAGENIVELSLIERDIEDFFVELMDAPHSTRSARG